MDKPLSRREVLRGRFLGGLVKKLGDKVEEAARTASAPFTDALATPNEAPRSPAPVPRGRPGGFPLHRPPGAASETEFLTACTRCNDCAKACPHGAIVPAPERLGAAAGTPVIQTRSAPCHMCADTPCITACATGALAPGRSLRMGTARIQTFHCIAHRGTTCTTCVERCPVEGAISLRNGRPVVAEEICTGCGVCQFLCPAPENAILVLPRFERG